MAPQQGNAPAAANPIQAERNERRRKRLAADAAQGDAPAPAAPDMSASDWVNQLAELVDRVANLEGTGEATAELLLTHSTELEGLRDSVVALEADADGDGDGDGDGNGNGDDKGEPPTG